MSSSIDPREREKSHAPVEQVDFYTQALKASEQFRDEYKGRLKVAKMDVDHHQLVPQQYGVKSIPTLLIFKGGKVVGQLVGALPRNKLEAEIQKHI